MYTIIQTARQTARLNGLDPQAYLRDVMGRIRPPNQPDRATVALGLDPARQ